MKHILMTGLYLAFAFAFTAGDTCGGNCPQGGCKNCYYGTTAKK